MKQKKLIATLKKIAFTDTNSESNTLWTAYFSQYQETISVLLEVCQDNLCHTCFEDIFIPICFLTAHYMELWIKTIAENYGIGNMAGTDAKLLPGHSIDKLLSEFKKNLNENDEEMQRGIERVAELYSELALLSQPAISLSEAMRYPISKKDMPTLSKTLSECIEWQHLQFDFDRYFNVIEHLLFITSESTVYKGLHRVGI